MKDFQNINPKRLLTLEQEVINRTSFVETEITRIPNILDNWYIRVCMWNIHTGKIIQACVCHPPEYKHASVRYFLNRLPPHVINKIEAEKETTMNQGISHKSSYPRETLNVLNFKPPSNKKRKSKFYLHLRIKYVCHNYLNTRN
jgi:hypothetical protein